MLDTKHVTPKPPERRFRLRTVFVAILALVMLVCVLGMSLLWEPRVERVMTEAQVQSLELKVEILSDALVPFLLQNDFGAIFETLDSTQARIPNWEQVTLTNMSGQLLYPLSSVQEQVEGATIFAEKTIVFEGRKLATLRVGSDISGDLGEIREQVRELSILLSVVFLGLLVLLGLLFERWVVRRIALLASAARQLSLGDYDARLPDGISDEIGLLTRSFGKMRQTIRQNEKKLIASRDEAQRAAEAKSRFLAMMSHEIRTPLNGVIPAAELLLEGVMSPEQRQLVGTIQDSGKALKIIIDDILDISKLDEGRFVIRSETFALHELVQKVAGMFQVSARQKGLSLNVELDARCHQNVVGDPDRLRQVLINLVGNAIKFTPQGELTIRVEPAGDGTSSSKYQFEVVDTGIGISDDDQAKIFERFTQVDNRSNREFQGSGLGLSICKLLVEAMGGELQVDSRSGEGSRFYFTLPLVEAEDQPKQTPALAKVAQLVLQDDVMPVRTDVPKMAETVESTGLRVLIVDDNRTNLKIASAILKSMGHAPSSAENGMRALERLEDEEFDLVLMDVNMPGIDGLETTRRIRKGPAKMANTIILGLSAGAFPENIEACIASGMNGFLAKPLSKKKLVLELETYFQAA
ncbi:ATP-binding protein [Actibacterium pelagium]|uniref:histidine kinase n=1 Tax=Actibacterium pelagium TaxID=2029103 RepID=A0A917AEH0_9RHOB|nr:ATP-binding protein [Actibacterium pelagium]GGE46268.1 hypothetical protein GCM10011517_12450 [Actibacterium pelagium]